MQLIFYSNLYRHFSVIRNCIEYTHLFYCTFNSDILFPEEKSLMLYKSQKLYKSKFSLAHRKYYRCQQDHVTILKI